MGKKVSKRWEKNKKFKKPFEYKPESFDADDDAMVIRRLDMDDILELGVSNELDFMSKALMTEESDGKNAVKEAVKSGEGLMDMKKMINAICLAGIIEPKIYPVPMVKRVDGDKVWYEQNDAARQPGLFYVDEIPFDDRVDLFGVIFDSEGLSTFREEQAPGVGDVANVPSVQLPADKPVDVRPDDTEGVLLQ